MFSVVCIGDSLVEGEGDDKNLNGWVGRLQLATDANHGEFGGVQVYGLGIGGHSILDIYYRLNEVMVRQPDMVILGCGTNDIKYYTKKTILNDKEPNLSGYRIDSSWDKVLKQLKAMTDKVLVVGMCEKFGDIPQGATTVVAQDQVAKHNKFIAKKCQEFGCEFLDIENMLEGETDKESLFAYGVHWNGKGYDAVFERIKQKINQLGWLDVK